MSDVEKKSEQSWRDHRHDVMEMNFGELLYVSEVLTIRRVNDGWIYEYSKNDDKALLMSKRIIVSTCFVPKL